MTGFSLYFSPEHRWWTEHLLNRKVVELRPHWVNYGQAEVWAEYAIRLSNIKYYIPVSSHRKQIDLNGNWVKVETGTQSLDLYLYKNWASMLRIFDKWVVEPDNQIISERISNPKFDPTHEIFLNDDPNIKIDDSGIELKYKIDLVKHTGNEIILQIETNKNSILYLPEYFDKYWQAYVDKKKAIICRGNYAYRAVPISAGTRHIRLKYVNQAFKFGFITSIVTILMLIIFSVVSCLRCKSRK